ncbi:hypothetical protein T459_14771 [Capsicum annuum]|uniref:Uncharacterized protein n=1 Tax=Capsicum annuum TaxID=4072 RepID=A0A2G2ZIF0_CAPAN|nr:hypothetical protein T459_14771 [Capsicum annuum]
MVLLNVPSLSKILGSSHERNYAIWKLVEIDVDLLKLSSEMKLVMSLINPASTYMDLNIGITLWLDAGGDGCLQDETGSDDTFDHAK